MKLDALHTTAALLGVLAAQCANVSAVSVAASSAPSGNALYGAAAPARIADASTNALELEARQLPGSEAILVTGKAAPNARLTLTVLDTISSDLPTAVLNRHVVQSGGDGRFGVIIPIAPAYQRGTLITVHAEAAGQTGDAHLSLDAPNAGTAVPFDTH